MRSQLDRQGRLLPPTSVVYALERCKQLAHEISSIERTLVDIKRKERFASQGDYDRWVRAARTVVAAFKSEARQLETWLLAQFKDLLLEVWDVLKEIVDDIEYLEPREERLVKRLEEIAPAISPAVFRAQRSG